MSEKRVTGPRVVGRPSGPRIGAAQPTTPPTQVHIGNDRLLAGAREVDVAQISPDPEQPRRAMPGDRLAELARSIATYGLLQPLVVRQDGLGRDGDMRYTVIAGGRRFAAIRLAIAQASDEGSRRRLSRVPVVVTESAAAQHRVLQLVENLQRQDLSPLEEARAFKEIMELDSLTMQGLAGRLHRSQGYVDERLRLLRHEEVEAAVESGLLTKSAGAAIASISSPASRRRWLERAQAGETIRPRDVYASKPDRRKRHPVAGVSALRGVSLASAGSRPPDRVLPPPTSSLDAASHLVQPLDVPDADASALPSAGDASIPETRGAAGPTGDGSMLPMVGDASILEMLGVGTARAARRRWQSLSSERRAAIAGALVDRASPDARVLLERALTAGALLGISCEALLELLGGAPARSSAIQPTPAATAGE